MTTATAVPENFTKPVRVFRDRRLSVSVFRNPTRDQERTFHSVFLQRSYKDGDAYKAIHSLGKDDLPAAQLLLAQAWEWLVNEEAALRKKAA